MIAGMIVASIRLGTDRRATAPRIAGREKSDPPDASPSTTGRATSNGFPWLVEVSLTQTTDPGCTSGTICPA